MNAREPRSSPRERARVLVVDDDPALFSSLERHLRADGFEVECAENGRAGLAKADRFRPDIILSDLAMPVLDGRGLCGAIKADPRFAHTYFILLTGRGELCGRATGLELGADAYLSKPCPTEDVLAHLHAAERIVRLQKELHGRNRELREARDQLRAELEETSAIQRALLPQVPHGIPGYSFSARYLPQSQCGGDYYDILPLPDGRVGLFVADVVGHGAPAMVAMSVVRCLVHSSIQEFDDPAGLLEHLDALLVRHLPTKQFVTAICALLDPSSNHLQYCIAGHPPPIVIERDDLVAGEVSAVAGVPLNISGVTPKYHNFSVRLQEGDVALIYTDGITEMRSADARVYGPTRLLDSVCSHTRHAPDLEELADGIVADLERFAAGARPTDDRTLLLLGRNA